MSSTISVANLLFYVVKLPSVGIKYSIANHFFSLYWVYPSVADPGASLGRSNSWRAKIKFFNFYHSLSKNLNHFYSFQMTGFRIWKSRSSELERAQIFQNFGQIKNKLNKSKTWALFRCVQDSFFVIFWYLVKTLWWWRSRSPLSLPLNTCLLKMIIKWANKRGKCKHF